LLNHMLCTLHFRSILQITLLLFLLAGINFTIMLFSGTYVGFCYLLAPVLIATCGYQGLKARNVQLMACFSNFSLLAATFLILTSGLTVTLLIALFQFSSSDCMMVDKWNTTNVTIGDDDFAANGVCVCSVNGETVEWSSSYNPCNSNLTNMRYAAATSALFTMLMAVVYCTGFTTSRRLQRSHYFTNIDVNGDALSHQLPVAIVQPMVTVLADGPPFPSSSTSTSTSTAQAVRVNATPVGPATAHTQTATAPIQATPDYIQHV